MSKSIGIGHVVMKIEKKDEFKIKGGDLTFHPTSIQYEVESENTEPRVVINGKEIPIKADSIRYLKKGIDAPPDRSKVCEQCGDRNVKFRHIEDKWCDYCMGNLKTLNEKT